MPYRSARSRQACKERWQARNLAVAKLRNRMYQRRWREREQRRRQGLLTKNLLRT